MNGTILENLAEYASTLEFEDLPTEVVSRANDCFYDLVGCYFAALSREENSQLVHKVMMLNPKPEVTVWGMDKKCGIAEAALAIGTLSYDLEYDDGVSLGGHWGSASIPATFLSTELHGGDGKRLLTAIVAAYETGTRISRMYSPRLLKKHVHFPCLMGAFAATAGYCNASGASSSELTGALSLAGLYPIGTYSTAISGAQGKGLYSGWPNFLGINTIRLSNMGLCGDHDVMESPDGFGNVFGLGSADDTCRSVALDGLGSKYYMMQVYFKPYPCCRWLHAPIQAVLGLMQKYNLKNEEIEKIQISGPEFIMMYNKQDGFDSKVTCQYSIPYSVGAAAYFGELGLKQYELQARCNPRIIEIARRVEVGVDDELQRNNKNSFTVRASIECIDGRVFETEQGMPWGAECPPTKQELIQKFNSITADILSVHEQEEWAAIYLGGMECPGAFKKALALLGKRR